MPVATWSFRACVIQGSQQIYLVVLWYWGSRASLSMTTSTTRLVHDPSLTRIALPIALLMWIVCIVLFHGLPDYYRQAPERIPSFYKPTTHRKIILVSATSSFGPRFPSFRSTDHIISVVLCHGGNSEFLSRATIQPQLEVSLV